MKLMRVGSGAPPALSGRRCPSSPDDRAAIVFGMKYLTDAQCFAPDCGRTFWATTEQLRAMTRANRNRTYCPEHRSAHDSQR